MATSWLNGMDETHWIMFVLEVSSWLTLKLQPDIFENTLNMDIVRGVLKD
jgi:hypothetical protein